MEEHKVELDRLILQMADNAQSIRALAGGVLEEQARFKPDPDSWSILEVVNHLLDEEKEDFRVRLDYTLHRPDEEWPPIDPQGWVTAREYNERDLGESLRFPGRRLVVRGYRHSGTTTRVQNTIALRAPAPKRARLFPPRRTMRGSMRWQGRRAQPTHGTGTLLIDSEAVAVDS